MKKIEDAGGANEAVTVYFGPVEIRNFGQGTSEEVITYPHGSVRLVNGAAEFLHADQLGSVKMVTDSAGLKASQNSYKPFGEVDTTVHNAAVEAETKGFIGERYDSDAGLQYLNARYYDPELGIFVQPDWWEVDQYGVGTNRYAYSAGDPINRVDPYGNGFWDALAASANAEVQQQAYFEKSEHFQDLAYRNHGGPSSSEIFNVRMAAFRSSDVEVSMDPDKAILGGLVMTHPHIDRNDLLGGGGGSSRAIRSTNNESSKKFWQIIQNFRIGKARENRVQKRLEAAFPNATIQREVYLRDASGKIARISGSAARRIDHAVIENGKVQFLIETTGRRVRKGAQIAREQLIRRSGGHYILDRQTGQLIDISSVATRIVRVR